MKKRSSGFTLMEMLTVVAIVAVLVAIAIPVFANQLEKSREAVDLANLRAAYAEVMTAANTDLGSNPGYVAETNPWNGVMWDNSAENPCWYINVPATQTQAGWQGGTPDIGGCTNVPAVVKGGSAKRPNGWTVKYSLMNGLTIEKAGNATG